MANERAQAIQAAQNLFKIPELKSKILFTLLCLAVYRLGSHVPTAGVDVLALQQLAGQFQNTLFGIYNMFVGGALQRATVFAVTSGKGGVGKTSLSVNIACEFSRRGYRTIIVDTDLGLANSHILAGIKPSRRAHRPRNYATGGRPGRLAGRRRPRR